MAVLPLTTVNTIANVSILTVLMKLQLFSLIGLQHSFACKPRFLYSRFACCMLDGNTKEFFLEEFT